MPCLHHFPGNGTLYLENPGLWPDVHHALITECQEPTERATATEVHRQDRVSAPIFPATPRKNGPVPQVRVPDSSRSRRRVDGRRNHSRWRKAKPREIPEMFATRGCDDLVRGRGPRSVPDDRRPSLSVDAVTVIELLSPANKVASSPGRESFETKRREVMRSSSHWVEIDLLRGKRMVPVPRKVGPHQYLVHISRRSLRPRGELWGIRLNHRLPAIPIPLKGRDPDAAARSSQAAANAAYDRGVLRHARSIIARQPRASPR